MFKKINLLVLLLAVLMVSACATNQKAPKQEEEKFDYVSEEQAEKENRETQERLEEAAVEEVRVPDRIFFGFDKYALTSEAKDVLNKQAEWLKQDTATRILVEGHCDERGTREYNLALGERRANAAKRYLVQQGIDGKRISTISYGKDRPEFLGAGEKIWSKNRRAVTVVVEE